MPLLTIETNRELADVDRERLLDAASTRVAELLGKPERYVMVSLRCNPLMRFAGSAAPLAYLELKSIGLPGERTAALSAALTELIATHTGIAAERVYIEFGDVERHLWGWNGATFAR